MERVEKSVEVDCPVRAVYDQWTRFEEFPKFMSGVKEVTQTNDLTMHWHADVWGHDTEWDAEITERVPDERISWRSTSGAPHNGSVRFEPLARDRTLVRLTLGYEPPQSAERRDGALDIFAQRVESTMRDFKTYMERRRSADGAWRNEDRGNRRQSTTLPPRRQ